MRCIWATLGLAACLGMAHPATAETDDEVAGRVRAFVEMQWSPPAAPEVDRSLDYRGIHRPQPGVTLMARCDGGPVGLVTYTHFPGRVCAVFPYRTSEGAIRIKVAISAQGWGIMEGELPNRGGTFAMGDGSSVELSPFPASTDPGVSEEEAKSQAMAGCAPANTVQAIACLDTHWSPEVQTKFTGLAASDVIRTHHGVGTWIRNNWGLWRGGPLRDFFAKQDVAHPDSMSSALLNAYWLKMHGCRLDWNDSSAVAAAFEEAKQGKGCSKS